MGAMFKKPFGDVHMSLGLGKSERGVPCLVLLVYVGTMADKRFHGWQVAVKGRIKQRGVAAGST